MSEADQKSEAIPTVTKADVTRQKIIDAALELSSEHGYDKTTMRAIAKHAGVSVGNAYYYFASKDALMQGYYFQILEQYRDGVQPVLESESRFADRLMGASRVWLQVAEPFHAFATGFFRFAANPQSPLSPFSAESAPAREANIEVMREVVEGSRRFRVSDDLRDQLPRLLWMLHMGMVLHWVYDDSPSQRRTEELVERVVPLVEKLLGASRLPVLRSTTREVVALLDHLLPQGPGPDR